jgi:glycosyltransferase involved in cell wall biosynthesis
MTPNIWQQEINFATELVRFSMNLSDFTVEHVSTFSQGGAGRIAKILVQIQNEIGISSRLISYGEYNLRSNFYKFPLQFFCALIDNIIFTRFANTALFSILRAKISLKSFWQTKKTVYHLHWIPGVLSLKDLSVVMKNDKIVITLHDAWFFTGGCHYNDKCFKFQTNCHKCPQTGFLGKALIKKQFDSKYQIFLDKKIDIVSPSLHLLNLARTSPFFNKANFHIIPNPVDVKTFKPTANNKSSSIIKFVIVMQTLNDPAKQLYSTLDLLQDIYESGHRNFEVSLIGNGTLNKTYDFKIRLLGFISTSEKLNNSLQDSSLLILNSLYENFPNVILESMAASTPVISSNVGGVPEIISHMETGFLFSGPDEFKSMLIDVLDLKFDLELIGSKARNYVVDNCSPIKVAHQYSKLYEKLIS